MSERLERMMKKLEGDGPVEKHILLLKLSEAFENAPGFGDKAAMDANTPQRQWLSQVGALLKRLGIEHSVQFKSSFNMLGQYWQWATTQIKGQVLASVAWMK